MELFVSGLLVIAVGAVGCLLLGHRARAAGSLALVSLAVGSALASGPVLSCLLSGLPVSLRVPWLDPRLNAQFSVEIDALSAFFLLAIFGLSVTAALFGRDYLEAYAERKNVGAAWFCYGLLVISMALVVVSRNAVLFLLAWELMSISSFFLVTFEDELEQARAAGWTYLVATHLGTALLLAMFLILGHLAGDSLDFDKFAGVAAGKPVASLLFIFALLGFGVKAGFFPLHVWMPEAQPAAPSHVSALMSGVMIKLGIYGLLRVLTFLGPPQLWWGWLLVLVGMVSGVFGILFALAQYDVKRLLAYSSVANVGVIGMGLGLGLIGVSAGVPSLVVLGYGGALLHVWNHALFKGLLFLGAGVVERTTGTRNIEELGGLMKSMPWTGGLVLLGGAAVCGLPPLNGFVSEFLIYLGAFQAVAGCENKILMPAIGIIVGLALIGGLAVACYSKVCGVIFLGEPRQGRQGQEATLGQCVAMGVLAAACLGGGLLGAALLPHVEPVLAVLAGPRSEVYQQALADARVSLSGIVVVAVFLLGLALLLAVRMRYLVKRHGAATSVTWDCGYLGTSARMQYTASSFAQPLTELFRGLLRTHTAAQAPTGTFPEKASLTSHTPDSVREEALGPVFQMIGQRLSPLRRLQHGRVQVYVLYIALTLLILLLWKL